MSAPFLHPSSHFPAGRATLTLGVLLLLSSVPLVAQEVIVQSEVGSTASQLGSSVSNAGDVDRDGFDDFVVGMPYASGSAPSGGEVRVISGRTGSVIHSNSGASNEHVGLTVAGDFDANGDGRPDYAAGYNNLDAAMSGGVRVYDGATGALLFQTSASSGGLGLAVAGLRDINGNGRDEIIVGRPQASIIFNPLGAGLIRVLEYSPTTGVFSTLLTDVGGFTNGNYGTSVADAGDLDGDGVSDIAIGEPRYSEVNQFVLLPGRIRVLSGQAAANGTATQIRSYRGTDSFGQVGVAIATGGDIDGDGIPDLMAGSLSEIIDVFPGAGGQSVLNIAPGFGMFPGFGQALAFVPDVSGDGLSDLAIGTPLDSQGKVRLHSGQDGSVVKIISGRGSSARFGAALASGCDADGDGVEDLVVGAPLENLHAAVTAGVDQGYARVFSLVPLTNLTGTTLDFTLLGDLTGDGLPEYGISNGAFVRIRDGSSDAVLLNTVSIPNSVGLGFALATTDDLDGDGLRDILATAPFEDTPSAADVGAVYLISALFGNTIAVVNAGPYQQAFSDYGQSICVLGDLNGDGVSEFAVGAPSSSVSAVSPQSGIVLIHSGINGLVMAALPGGAAGDDFGMSLANVGDLDGDGVADMAVGAPNAMGGKGEVRVFSGSTLLGFNPTTIYVVAGTGTSEFGFDVARAGDVDGDGMDDILVGEPGYSSFLSSNRGRARVISGATGLVVRSYFGEVGGDRFGAAVSGIGDVDGDGLCDVAIAAPFFSQTLNNAGRVYVLSSMGQTRAIINGNAGDLLGERLLGIGDRNGDCHGDILIKEGVFNTSTYIFTPGRLDGLEAYGQGTPGCDGRLCLAADSPPRIGNTAFSIVLDNGPPTAPGGIFVADLSAKLDPGQDLLGIGLIFHVNLGAVPAPQAFPVTTDVTGHASVDAGIPYIPALAGTQVILQGIWYEGACQTNGFGYSTTNGLELTILP